MSHQSILSIGYLKWSRYFSIMRLLAIVSYNGSNYAGWQRQPNGKSVQETIETELSRFFNTPIVIYGAGRTDAGVHALGQTFHFDIDKEEVDISRLLYSLNSMLPPDIYIEDMEEVDSDFHARFSAKEKIYGYTIILRDKEVLLYPITYVCPYPVDTSLMEKCLNLFKGKHNFKNFTSKEVDKDNFVREIYDISFEVNNDTINIVFRGDGFMRYMIRFIVGTALEVGKRRMTLEEVDELLDENSPRHIMSPKAPASGLVLLEVKY